MREYGQVQSTFWQSADAQAFSDQAKVLALYLLTGPHTNGIGCFLLPDGYVMADLGWTAEMVSKGFAELYRYGFAYRIDRVVFIPKFLRWNPIQNPKVAVSRVVELNGLPDGEAKARAARALLEFGRHLSESQRNLIDTVCQTVSKLEPDPIQTLTQKDQDQKQKQPPAKKPPAADEPVPEPPDWVDRDAWTGFSEMRKRLRYPLTARAARLVFRELEKLRTNGHDPTAVLDQSTRNSWRDVYPIKQEKTNGNHQQNHKLSAVEQVQQAILERRTAAHGPALLGLD